MGFVLIASESPSFRSPPSGSPMSLVYGSGQESDCDYCVLREDRQGWVIRVTGHSGNLGSVSQLKRGSGQSQAPGPACFPFGAQDE